MFCGVLWAYWMAMVASTYQVAHQECAGALGCCSKVCSLFAWQGAARMLCSTFGKTWQDQFWCFHCNKLFMNSWSCFLTDGLVSIKMVLQQCAYYPTSLLISLNLGPWAFFGSRFQWRPRLGAIWCHGLRSLPASRGAAAARRRRSSPRHRDFHVVAARPSPPNGREEWNQGAQCYGAAAWIDCD